MEEISPIAKPVTIQEAIKLLWNEHKKLVNTDGNARLMVAVGMGIEALEERKTGKWIEKDGWDGDVYYDCSACGESWITIEGTPWDNDMNYCPHCGAKMEGE